MFGTHRNEKGFGNALTSSGNNFYMVLHVTHAILNLNYIWKKVDLLGDAVTTHSDAVQSNH